MSRFNIKLNNMCISYNDNLHSYPNHISPQVNGTAILWSWSLLQFGKQQAVQRVLKTGDPFSGMPPDQAGEQCNELYKEFHGGLGSDVNKRAIVAGPVVHHLFEEFESSESLQTGQTTGAKRHHEDTPSQQRVFFDNVRKLTDALLEACNPFSCGKNLYFINNGQLMGNYEAIAASLRSLESNGEEQYQEFRIERLIQCVVPLDTPIQMLNLTLPTSKIKPVKEKCFKGNLWT